MTHEIEDRLQYLHYCYLPPEDVHMPYEVDCSVEVPCEMEEAIRVGGAMLRRSILATLEDTPDCVIPLSGGLDSRAILMTALDHEIPVRTYTYGTPSSLDFEIGDLVSRELKVDHCSFDLTRCQVTTEGLLGTLEDGGTWTYPFDAYYNRLPFDGLRSGERVISGFAGGVVSGGHASYPPLGIDSSIRSFVESQRYTKAVNLMPRELPVRCPRPPSGSDIPEGLESLTPSEWLAVCVRLDRGMMPITVTSATDVATPFVSSEWLGFIFRTPLEWRSGKKLFRAILRHEWPCAYAYPTKNNFGLPGSASERSVTLARGWQRIRNVLWRELRKRRHAAMVNYVDLGWMFRERSDYAQVARENLGDLESRGLLTWLEPFKLLERHVNRERDLSREIQALIGFELNLKSIESH